jgi:ATP-binding cassette, subfamily B, bacterial
MKNFIARLVKAIGNTRGQLPYIPRTLALVWKAARGWTIAWVSLLLLQGLLPAITVSLTRSFVDNLSSLLLQVHGGTIAWAMVLPTLTYATGIGLVMVFGQVVGGISSLVYANLSELVGISINDLIYIQSYQVDYAFYETPADNDRLFRARSEASYRPLSLLDNLGNLAQSTVTLVAMGALILRYGAWLPIALLISTLPALVIVVVFQRQQFHWQKKTTPDQRRSWYYEWLLTTRESAAELRLLGLGDYFRQSYNQVRRQLFKERLRMNRNQAITQLLASLAGIIILGGCMAWVGWQALAGRATLGDLAMFYAAFNQGQSLLRNLLQSAGQLYSNLLFISNLFEFLDLKPAQPDPVDPVQLPADTDGVSLRFDNISFKYPGSDRFVLQDFNLEIPAGKLVAIVGDNGAGKSTLMKLICRLYEPQQGQVSWNGMDIRQTRIAELRSQISIMFQEPIYYQATVHDNIAYGHWGKTQPGEVEKAAWMAGATGFIQQLPQGFGTQLGKYFETGVDLSVGQWHRITQGRAFIRHSALLLMDEPTEAMDAWAEAEWLARLRQTMANRTVVLISHRLTTAMQADLIYVMVDGKIVEIGTHQELVSRNGRYNQAWQLQMSEIKSASGSPGQV